MYFVIVLTSIIDEMIAMIKPMINMIVISKSFDQGNV